MTPIDLHVHSTCSDGTFTPTELVKKAKEIGLTAFALTDHDTTDGLDEAIHTGLREGIDVVPGIELSTEYNGRDIHILGYCFDYADETFQSRVHEFSDARDIRNRKMCEALQAGGINVPYDDLMKRNPNAVVTRAQFAKYMLDHGIIKSLPEAFDRYIGDDCKYFIPREKISPKMAVEFILKYHGVPVLAHPFQYKLGKEALEKLILSLKEVGMMGLECVYSKYSPSEVNELKALAAKYDLVVTGGSDFHGANKPGLEMGTGFNKKLYVPDDLLVKMRRRLYGTSEHTKIFFSDLDGTLLTSEKIVSPKTMDVLKRWTEAGNYLVLNSGRALYDIELVYRETHLDELKNVYLCACNGALLFDAQRNMVIFREDVDKKLLNDIFDDCASYGVYVHTYTDTGIAARVYEKETKFYQRFHHMKVVEAGLPKGSSSLPDETDLAARKDYYALPKNREGASLTGTFCPDYLNNPAGGDITKIIENAPCKCIAIEIEDPKRIDALRLFLKEKYGDTLDVFMSNEYYLEIISIFSGKGKALRRFAKKLGVPVENTLAAGDAENDISMVKDAHIGIAMINGVDATPELKKAADLITKEDNDHDGLAPILEENL